MVIINKGKIAAVDSLSDLSKRLSGQSKLLLTFRGSAKDAAAKIRTIKGISAAVPRVVDSKLSQLEIAVSQGFDQIDGLGCIVNDRGSFIS